MYGVDTPEDLAEYLTDEDQYWPDGLKRLAEEDVTVHPQGQVYIDVGGYTAGLALYVQQQIDRAGLRVEVSSKTRIAVFEKRSRCEEEGCYARARGGSNRSHLCTPHARQAKKERMKQGLPPVRGEDY